MKEPCYVLSWLARPLGLRIATGAASFLGLCAPAVAYGQVTRAADLVAAIDQGAVNAEVIIAPGTFELNAPLHPKPGMKIRGAGMGKTIIRNAISWAPGIAGLDEDEGTSQSGIHCNSYLFDFGEATTDVTLSDMTLIGHELHGAVCGVTPHRLELARLELKDFLWSAVRTFIMDDARIHDNVFIDAGGRSAGTSGASGGGLFLTYVKAAEIRDNTFSDPAGRGYYGIKGREARDTHIHHNSIRTDFAIELPFESDWSVEIDHNYLAGTVSIPKSQGGTVPAGGFTFHVHHNYFTSSYAFEYQHNGVEIDHNLFDFSVDADYGNLISGFDVVAAVPGGTKMHDNLIHNPGRGLYWNEGVYNDFSFYNNEVHAATTATPRTEGLFEFKPAREGVSTAWSTIQIRDNIFELEGTPRPLMRNAESYAATIENNTLVNVSDASALANGEFTRPRGPTAPLAFCLGANEEWAIDQWTLARPTAGRCNGRELEMAGTGGTGTAGAVGGGSGGDRREDTAGASSAGTAEPTSNVDHTSSGGCGCEAARGSKDSALAVVLNGTLLVFSRRRRRRRFS